MRTRQMGSKRNRSSQSDDEVESSGDEDYSMKTRSQRQNRVRVKRSMKRKQPLHIRDGSPSGDNCEDISMSREGDEEARRMADLINIVSQILPPVISAVQEAAVPRRRVRYNIETSESEEEGFEAEEEEEEEEEEEDEECDFGQSEAGRERRYLLTLNLIDRKSYKEREDNLLRSAACDIPLRYQVLDSGMPDPIKVQCLNFIRNIDDEVKRRTWIERILCIPFGQYTSSKNMIRREAAKHVSRAKAVLDTVVHGNLDAKNTLREMVAQSITCPEGRMPIIGLVGPPGIGKTTLARQGIAEVMKRPFFQISCGGMQDAASLRGHCYTWEGSTPGGIVNAIMQTGVMDPVILLDEVDKLNNVPKGGADVQSVLIHLLDPVVCLI